MDIMIGSIGWRRSKYLDDLERALRNVRRALPLGAGESPQFIVSGVEHLDPHLRYGSADYVEVVEAMRDRGLL
jgi:hypothetical protein